MKKILTLIFLSVFCLNAINAKVKWNLDGNTLTISGTGDMVNYTSNLAPWYSQRESIKNVIIKNGVTNIGYRAFYECTSLTSVTIPNSVTGVGGSAFSGCSSLTSITIPNSVTDIGGSAFWGCSCLTSITIPNSVTGIGESAFRGCSSLTSITIPESVNIIGSGAFFDCNNLTNLVYNAKNATLSQIGNYDTNSFPTSVKSVTIGEEVESIPLYFLYKNITSFTIPNSVTSIDCFAFYGCSGLTSVTISNSVTSIGMYAFCDCSGLPSITIPNSVMEISDRAFKGCSGLRTLAIPNSVTEIGRNAFEGCFGLTSITLPNSLTTIRTETFKGCSGLTSITIPNSVTLIEAFAFEDCYNLTSITCEAITPPKMYDSFYNIDKSTPVYVPVGCVEKYKAANGWKEFTNIIDNQLIANPVIAKIDAIGDVELSFECEDKIDKAIAAYEALTDAQKVLVSNYDILTTAIETYETLRTDADKRHTDKVRSDAVIAEINLIGRVEYTEYVKSMIDKAITAYNALTDNQKALVTNYDVLITAKQTYDKLASDKTKADAVIAKIKAIGKVEYTDVCKGMIDDASTAYEALTDEQKFLVTNRSILTTAKQTYENLRVAAEKFADDMAKADDVIAKINAIGNVKYTDACKGKIDDANTAYEALTEDQKALVTNLDVLTTAKQTYETLKAAAEKLAADKALFDKYKSEVKAIIETLVKEDDSDAVKDIIYKAISDIDALEYDAALSLDDNKSKVLSLVNSVDETVEIQRAEDQKATGIEELELAEKVNIYDLSGKKIARSMLKSGLYIRNGKKVLIK